MRKNWSDGDGEKEGRRRDGEEEGDGREGERERKKGKKILSPQESRSANRASWGGGQVKMERHDKRECGGNSKGTQLTWP